MAQKDELQPKNYVRINVINWLLTPLLLFFFGWPFFEISNYFSIPHGFGLLGSVLFAFGFTVTILHGHVTVSLGSAHRHHYYEWLEKHALTYGLFFHKGMISTRFRLLTLIIAVVSLFIGWLNLNA